MTLLRNMASPSLPTRRSPLLLALILIFVSPLFSLAIAFMVGDVRETEGAQDSAGIEELARFAVDEHNKKENGLLEFACIVKAKEQVVAGTLHHLTLEAIDAGKKKLYEAKVWVKPWQHFKELQEFKHVGDSPYFTDADLGAKREELGPGWHTVPANDPVVKDAANHALKIIHGRSNSLYPYELLDILQARAEVIEETAKFDMLLKVKRGSKVEEFKVEVHKNLEGNFLLSQMQVG
ncbi:cysteine proteinase inhibitor 12-like [Curcuma longa]|uniref:cysteine proteinase inhibitor 12-like n=1 Tax=Curcuma longa TaxID=136217 RepID=UPI003D9ED3A2